jgi:cystathionine beta-lyase
MGGVNTPLQPSSAIEYLDDEVRYPRYFNTLNHQVAADKISALEGAGDSIVTSSGMAAIAGILFGLLDDGDHVLFTEGLYGGTFALATQELGRLGIAHDFAAPDTGSLQQGLRDSTRMVFVESPSNPLLRVVDLAAVAKLAASRNVITAIDNTFATPILQSPLELGFDLVMHSGTKYLAGHSDLICGTVSGDLDLIARVRDYSVNHGGCLNAQDCYLLERSLKTLELRIDRQSRNAAAIAKALDDHARIRRVYYPGLASHPGHAVAARQMRGFGGMLSFELIDGIEPLDFLRRLRLVNCAISLGGVETTICQPIATSHAKMSAGERQRLGITDKLLRLSVGIEDAGDILDDLLQALH